MKAAVLRELNQPLSIEELEPNDLEYGQVLVTVLVSGICGSQLQEIAGDKGNANHLPHLLGHEGCGIVAGCGVGVTRVSVGDKVVMHWRRGVGIESDFPSYHAARGTVRGGKVTTFNTAAVVSENRLTHVADNVDPGFCALLGCGLSTALATIESEAAVKFGESVMIIGCGGLGMNLIRASRMAGAFPIIAVDILESKRDVAEQMGADVFFNAAKHPPNMKADVIIDTSGAAPAIEKALTLLAPSGRFIMIGQPRPAHDVSIFNARHMFDGEGKSIRATQGGGFNPSQDIPRYVRLFQAGRLNIDGIITHHLSLDDINKGIDLVRAGEAGRIMINM